MDQEFYSFAERIVKQIKNEIKRNQSLRREFREYSNFLRRFNMVNRRKAKLIEISNLLKQHDILLISEHKEKRLDKIHLIDRIELTIQKQKNLPKGKSQREASPIVKLTNNDVNTIEVSNEIPRIELFTHQKEAVKNLNKKFKEKRNFAGILAIPTGGGKTITSIYWLLQNFIDKNKKVLWIAHRHELLNQAKEALQKLANKYILPNKNEINYRVVSGVHERTANISPYDDFIIASKDSVYQSQGIINSWIENQSEALLVIDEAHHSPAKTYKKIIDRTNRKLGNNLAVLGLTATPFRTLKQEKGLLAKIFVDDIIYKIDIRTLISRGILSEPHFILSKTNFDMATALTKQDYKNIEKFDFGSISENSAEKIATNPRRNRAIVEHYKKFRKKYGKSILYAINIQNAIALNEVFQNQGISSDYIVSNQNLYHENRDNQAVVERFKKEEIEVLINVNILTEGFDVPNVKTVLLTRPTKSPIMMNQMIGRGLRGNKLNGTNTSYIVSFLDESLGIIPTPEELFKLNNPFLKPRTNVSAQAKEIICIEKFREFVKALDETVDTSYLNKLSFIERIPVGVYLFTISYKEGGEDMETQCQLLIYEHEENDYKNFVEELPNFFKEKNLNKFDSFSDMDLVFYSNEAIERYFSSPISPMNDRKKNVSDILQYYCQNETKPEFLKLEDREKYDIDRVAKEIVDKNMTRIDEENYKKKLWAEQANIWQSLFNYNARLFVNELNRAISKITLHEWY